MSKITRPLCVQSVKGIEQKTWLPVPACPRRLRGHHPARELGRGKEFQVSHVQVWHANDAGDGAVDGVVHVAVR